MHTLLRLYVWFAGEIRPGQVMDWYYCALATVWGRQYGENFNWTRLLDRAILQLVVGKIFSGQMFAPGSYYALGDLAGAGDSAILRHRLGLDRFNK